ncbi:hypothetical protein ILUMI_16052 [Ignelater luminosus]|uniref:Uncharacterized protein n=1 Tax=Ignelater luminosus TaxID=2038154 RepID=A0A8K0CR20_IGNLU|nr:hypothetical protein ILUMI_16052 [Ignelater luminosus]
MKVKLDELWDKYDKVQTVLETLDLDTHKFTANALNHITLNAKQHLGCLENLLGSLKLWDPIIIFLISPKLDNGTRHQWELQITKNKMPTLAEFYEFLEKRC